MSAADSLGAPLPGESWQRETTLADLEATAEFAHDLAEHLRRWDLVVLTGGLGAGKTTFVQALGEALGVEGQISSPTFVLSRIHRAVADGPDLVHVDAYRTDAQGLESLDLLATLPGSVTVVEWGRGLVEHALVGSGGSWLDLELSSIGPSGQGSVLASRPADAGHRPLKPAASGAGETQSPQDVPRERDVPRGSIGSRSFCSEPHSAGTPESEAAGMVAGIQTDFSETDQDTDGTPRRAVLRGYGPRWPEPRSGTMS
ncbi:tRNA (adenosine(37)-N6)-threonylcarbamoyltransferase complex ATPase subunit type 1 TsaE [Nesterenkonia muleiensis]|uniref:tRNA (adenosine(37)-N6)-threonylcarbamoyltransferase complex ATPase subunit type 1 TsaE n=1 Tax=Nesterenkonia muleiensis TaxID=2282648 RepID=UPI000E733A35|nr:tRNA (adenosine(37)-N6)-threonylcarbamoyltransferase complex ATPase subunit type 1 TsaE [Nesterenkonia muleiensis]